MFHLVLYRLERREATWPGESKLFFFLVLVLQSRKLVATTVTLQVTCVTLPVIKGTHPVDFLKVKRRFGLGSNPKCQAEIHSHSAWAYLFSLD